jgi:hypothetical protein
MRATMRNVVLAAGAILLGASGMAQAGTMHANVPFPFVINGREFPAGTYQIEREDMSSPVLLIRGEGNNRAVMFVTITPDNGREPTDKPALRFKRHENQYRLTSVWEQGEGWDVPGR